MTAITDEILFRVSQISVKSGILKNTFSTRDGTTTCLIPRLSFNSLKLQRMTSTECSIHWYMFKKTTERKPGVEQQHHFTNIILQHYGKLLQEKYESYHEQNITSIATTFSQAQQIPTWFLPDLIRNFFVNIISNPKQRVPFAYCLVLLWPTILQDVTNCNIVIILALSWS